MILVSLRDMAQREGLTHAAAFENRPVKWVISLDEEGSFLGLSQTLANSRTEEDQGRNKPQAKVFSIPRRSGRTVQTQADFLVDKSEYVLGVEPDGKRTAEELDKRRKLFLDQIHAAARATLLPELGATLRFLESEAERANCIAALEKDGYGSNELFTFKIEGELLHSHPDVRSYWTEVAGRKENGVEQTLRQCVVCGELRQPVDKHDALQIPGGVMSGVRLVTFNSAAFEKYGLERNENAPLCRPCMTAYVEALRRCLSERYPRPEDPEMSFPKQSVRLTADTTAIYWSAAPSNVIDTLSHLSDGPADVKAALESPWHGSVPGKLEHERFHCLILTGSQGRAIIRSLHVNTLGGLVKNLKTYFDNLVVPGTQPERPLPLFALLRSLAHAEKIDKLPPGLAADVFLAAVVGRPLPRRVLSSAVARNAATQSVTQERAALLHLYFALQPNAEKLPMPLDVDNLDPAYRLGRLLAVLEAIQYQAQGALNQNVVNRYYSAAATRPGSVFPKMLELAQHHLAKLPPGSRNFRQKQLCEVINEIVAFSPMQMLEEQGRFALGYYHQRHARFQKAAPEVSANADTKETTNEEGAE